MLCFNITISGPLYFYVCRRACMCVCVRTCVRACVRVNFRARPGRNKTIRLSRRVVYLTSDVNRISNAGRTPVTEKTRLFRVIGSYHRCNRVVVLSFVLRLFCMVFVLNVFNQSLFLHLPKTMNRLSKSMTTFNQKQRKRFFANCFSSVMTRKQENIDPVFVHYP